MADAAEGELLVTLGRSVKYVRQTAAVSQINGYGKMLLENRHFWKLTVGNRLFLDLFNTRLGMCDALMIRMQLQLSGSIEAARVSGTM